MCLNVTKIVSINLPKMDNIELAFPHFREIINQVIISELSMKIYVHNLVT